MTAKYRGYTLDQITSVIDHSVLKPDATRDDIIEGARVAMRFHTATLCIRPCDVPLASELLAGSGVGVATVIGFPHGTTTTATKVFESLEAIDNGATELDMVLNVSALVSGDSEYVLRDIAEVVRASKAKLATCSIKVIFETALLTSDQIVEACKLTELAGADYVKTSTGFSSAGATLENVTLMKRTVGDRLKVKSSGGVKTLDQLVDFIEAGVSRSGCSATSAVVAEFEQKAS